MLRHTRETRKGEEILIKNTFIAVLFKSSKNNNIGNKKNKKNKNAVNRICITNPNSILPDTKKL